VTAAAKISLSVFVGFVVLSAVGFGFFPDAPLKMHDGIVTGKYGRVHSTEQLYYFRLWERTYIVVGAVFGLWCIGGWLHHLGSMRHQRPNNALERTADRRKDLLVTTSTLKSEGQLAPVSGRSACSR
jgi:hypothetical protein